MTEKARFRQELLEERHALSSEKKAQWNAKIAQKVLQSNLFRQAEHIFCYVSLPHEVDTRTIIERAWQLGKVVAVPKCNTSTHTMTFHRIQGEEDLRPGNFGIQEPADHCPVLIPEAGDLCIVPALTVDQAGHRLGYGGGYYDRYLAYHPVHTMVLTYELVKTLPVEPWDIPMGQVITAEDIE